MADELYLVFDVESIGLHGEGYAVGGVVITREGKELDSFRYSCDPSAASGGDTDRAWVMENVPPISITHRAPAEVRDAFWEKWMHWKERGARAVADCCWPVEAGFFSACVKDNLNDRLWHGPYPLLDLAPVLLVRGRDPLGEFARLENELPKHDPLADARQSARVFLEAL